MLREPGADMKVQQELLRQAYARTTMNATQRRSANKNAGLIPVS